MCVLGGRWGVGPPPLTACGPPAADCRRHMPTASASAETHLTAEDWEGETTGPEENTHRKTQTTHPAQKRKCGACATRECRHAHDVPPGTQHSLTSKSLTPLPLACHSPPTPLPLPSHSPPTPAPHARRTHPRMSPAEARMHAHPIRHVKYAVGTPFPSVWQLFRNFPAPLKVPPHPHHHLSPKHTSPPAPKWKREHPGNARGSTRKMHEGARQMRKRQNTTTPRVPKGSLTQY